MSVIQLLFAALLVLANGFFVGAEFALVSIRDTRIEQLLDALTHFSGGFVGERHRKNRIRSHALLLDKPRDPARDHTCLSRSRTGKNQQRAFRGLHGGTLFGVQFCNERLRQSLASGGKDSFL